MAKRRRRRNSDFDFAKLIVGCIFLMSFAFTKNIETALKLAFALLIFCGAVVSLVVYLRRSSPQLGFTSKKPSPYLKRKLQDQSLSKLDREYERQLLAQKKSVAEKPLDWSLELIKSLDWKGFEELCAGYFQAKGRKAQVTDLGADGGIDVLLFGNNDPEKVLGVVQCKAWTQKPVGVREIRELLGVMTDVGCPLGVYVTTSTYTPNAKSFANSKHIKLMDAEQLLALIQELPVESRAELLKKTTSGDFTTPSCPNCGIKLVSRTSRKGHNAGHSFWGCRNFPRCRYTMHRAKSA